MMALRNCANCKCEFFKEKSGYKNEEFNTDYCKNSRTLVAVAFENVLSQNIDSKHSDKIKLCLMCTKASNEYCNSRKQFLRLCGPNSKLSLMLKQRNCNISTSCQKVRDVYEPSYKENDFTEDFLGEAILPDQGNESDQELRSVNEDVTNHFVKQESSLVEYKEKLIKLELNQLSEKTIAQYFGHHHSSDEKSEDKSCLYKCLECTRIFSTSGHLENHKSLVHTLTKREFSCSFCPKTFSMVWFLRNHLKVCHNGFEILRYCQICKRKFYTENDLNEHKLKMHDVRQHPYKCKNCTDSFQSIPDLRSHLIKIHKGTKEALAAECNLKLVAKQDKEKGSYNKRCKFCKATFFGFVSLEKHVINKHGNEKTNCEICRNEFKCYKSMIEHRECHKNCPTCAQSFPDYTEMMVHARRSHFTPGDLPFECEICGQRYPISHRLLTHYKWHGDVNGPKRYCNICNKAFSLKAHLTQHLKSHFEKPAMYKCDFCPKVCAFVSNLNYHLQMKHKERVLLKYPCNFCEQKFSTYKGLTAHKRIHTIRTSFKNQSIATNINKTEFSGGKIDGMSCYSPETFLFTCPICPKSVESQTHFFRHLERSHSLKAYGDPKKTNLMPTTINCSICDKGFVRKDLLTKHMRVVHKLYKGNYTIIPPRTEVPAPACPQCGKLITRGDQALKVHLSRHEIYIVEDAFNNPTRERDLHEFYNEDEKKFTCPVCQKTFKKQSQFLCHVVKQSHSIKVIYPEKKKIPLPFKCEQCPGLQYSTEASLMKHRQSHRFRKDRIQKCSICNKTLRSLKYLKIHMQTQH